jgi:pimeloyl-ACP methyl ester carboxylesterase
VGTDLRAMAGLNTSYEEGVMQALDAAGVGPHTDVMLVGHSEGGIIAINTARDAVRSGRFRVTHVVTAGSPIGEVSDELPRSVQVLALENDDDVVPATDSADNPEDPNITTVHVADEPGGRRGGRQRQRLHRRIPRRSGTIPHRRDDAHARLPDHPRLLRTGVLPRVTGWVMVIPCSG